MKHLVDFRVFESAGSGLTQKQEAFLNRYTEGTWSYDPATGLVNVQGNLNCFDRRLKTLQGISFGDVSGRFDYRYNKLTSLAGAPQKVGGDFYCNYNNLTSLEGAPQKVGRDFCCDNNNLTSLEGAPQKVGGDFCCDNNNLTSLAGAPQKVGGEFNCKWNNLTSLEGAPQEIGNTFFCNAFMMGQRKWNSMGWVKDLQDMGLEAQKLLLALLPAKELNKEIRKDPAGMVMKLKEIWNLPNFEKIKNKLVWPKGYEEKMDLVGGLNTLGF